MNKNNLFENNKLEKWQQLFRRKKESEKIARLINNGKNIHIVGRKGIGKTIFLSKVLNDIQIKKYFKIVYLKVQETNDTNILLKTLINSIFEAKETNSTKLKKNLESKIPNIDFRLKENDLELVEDLLSYLAQNDKKIICVINDLGKLINTVSINFLNKLFSNKKSRFIFVSHFFDNTLSEKRLEKFQIYNSSELIVLESLKLAKYKKYIERIFKKNSIKIGQKAINYLLNWGQLHTKSIEFLCKKLLEHGKRKIEIEFLEEIIKEIVAEKSSHYLQYQKLVSDYQWKVLLAIAQESNAKFVTSTNFIEKYNLNAASSVKTAINSLLDKDLIFRTKDYYKITDVFFERWLAGKSFKMVKS